MQQIAANSAKDLLEQGGVIAYPTEAVYGFGCDPEQLSAVEKILTIKQRPWQKGMILIGSELAQFETYVDWAQLTAAQIANMQQKWPGPFTFVVPARAEVSSLIRGEFTTLAIRVSAHPVVRELCETLGKPLISTSANRAGDEPALSMTEILAQFSTELDAVVVGELGAQSQPSTIIDARTGAILR